ncbi:MAG: adenylate kinase [Gemmatimonadetes bacterium RIFCSPLOWO2_12_FULL_68_9]|uniref:Adenylate kinase n=1 Tax=uncultured Gemmatimonadetes bacterium Rifle_16ft_4_minimus_7 TaxID=1665098 RepID=A0A0H4T9V2_9BACT|nr:adenylate kinase [uncultured Gemmatimonadetes bacterium Rifle_16ft_4_minimus_7]OGU12962.1 MAG: adenylate kinase [Gemmatimonadetes bacterium RIFCSPLOWO2_12_FULL_68_9]
MNIILLGPPGCGKGTQGEILAERTGIVRVSTGDLLRDAAGRGTELGKRAKSYMDQGLLVPDDVIVGLLREVLASPRAGKGVIMDGFPRTVAQAEAVDTLLAERKRRVDTVLFFDVPDQELLKRITGRAAAEGRSDDNPESFRQRLVAYRQQTQPLVDCYRQRGILVEIEAVGSISEIAARVQARVGM